MIGRTRWAALVALAACGGGDADVDAAVATTDGGVDAPPPVTAEQVFDQTVVRRFELTVAPADWQWLQDHARDEQYVPADLRWGEVAFARVGLRFKGSVGTLALCFNGNQRTCPKLSMKLDFDAYVPGGRFAGLEHLDFHAMMRDPSHMKERLGYGLFRQAGVAAPRSAHARLVVNGADQGLFALVEEIDGEFVEDHFRTVDGSGAGNLYKEVWPMHASPEPYRVALETNRGPATKVDRIVRFADALRTATPATFRGVIAGWTDLPTLVSYLAVDRLIDHWDGFVGWYCPSADPTSCRNHNLFWYEEAGRDRLWLVPWDLDLTMQVPSPIRSNYGMPDWNASPADCALRPIFLGFRGRPPACDRFTALMAQVLWPDYQARTAALLAGPASEAVLGADIARMEALLAPEVASDAFGPGLAAWRQAVASLRADLPRLRARVAP